jgi:hypothetical protein
MQQSGSGAAPAPAAPAPGDAGQAPEGGPRSRESLRNRDRTDR